MASSCPPQKIAFFIKSNEFPAPYTDKTSTQNSLWFEEERQQWMFVMNKDKLTTRSAAASNKSQQEEMAILGKIPAQEIMNYSQRTLFFQKGDAITDLLNQSWEMFPRADVFPTFESCQSAISGGGDHHIKVLVWKIAIFLQLCLRPPST